MIALIVSPSAVLRSALREVLAKVGTEHRTFETGSTLQVERLLAEKRPQLVLWDEVFEGETDKIIERAASGESFHLVLLVSAGGATPNSYIGPFLTRMEKVDFASTSVDAYAQRQAPLLARLARQIESKMGRGVAPTAARRESVEMVVMGASTGGPAALRQVLEALPESFPCPVALVQHMDAGYEAGFVDWLKDFTRLRVRLARDNDDPTAGEVIVAPTGRHLVCRNRFFTLDDGPAVFSQKPAVDRLFSSSAIAWGAGLVGVLLTGIGSDGAQGCRDIVLHGGFTFVQDEATSAVWGMPKAAAELGAASRVLPIQAIGQQLLELVKLSKDS